MRCKLDLVRCDLNLSIFSHILVDYTVVLGLTMRVGYLCFGENFSVLLSTVKQLGRGPLAVHFGDMWPRGIYAISTVGDKCAKDNLWGFY